jgi:hypothetical protein
VSENVAVQNVTNRVSVNGRGLRPGIPVVVIIVAAIMLSVIAVSRVLLGLDSQKCPLSLTLNIKNIAK